MTGSPTLPLAANPSALWLAPVAALAVLAGLLALLPVVLLLGSISGMIGINPTIELSFLALPTTAVGLFFVVVGYAIVSDLQLRRPVLNIDEEGVFDRRVADRPIAWTEVAEAVLAPGGGAVQLALREPLDARVSPYRAGTMGIRATPPGQVLIPIRAMDRPAHQLASALLEAAKRFGKPGEADPT